MSNNKNNKNKGSVLLFVLLLLFAMIAIGFVLSSLTLREISLARHVDDATQAFYAAESGLEYGLDIISTARRAKSSFTDTMDKNSADNPLFVSDVAMDAIANNDVAYTIDPAATGILTDTVIFPYLNVGPQYAGAQIEVYNPDTPFSDMGRNAVRVRVDWLENKEECAQTQSQIEFSYIGLRQYYDVDYTAGTPTVVKEKQPCDSVAALDGYDCTATNTTPNDIDATTNFVFRVKPINCAVSNVRVSFFNPDNEAVIIPSRFELVASGEGRFSQRRMKASGKWLPSSQQLVDFVLFSVEKVCKADAATCSGS